MQGQDAIIMIVLAVVAIVAVVGIWAYTRRKRSDRLRTHFGPEYERAVSDFGDKSRAEKDLAERQKRVSTLNIRPLTAEERSRFSEQWQAVQGHFVDDPRAALFDADRLVTEVLKVRGYPVDDFDERFGDISAAYPNVAGSYRQACEIVARQGRETLTTEDMRKAMVLYRNLFEELFKQEPVPMRRVS